jgi:hypothetical protein
VWLVSFLARSSAIFVSGGIRGRVKQARCYWEEESKRYPVDTRKAVLTLGRGKDECLSEQAGEACG